VSPPPACALFIAPFARRNYYREAVRRLQALSAEFRARFGGEGRGLGEKPGVQRKRDYRILCNSPVPEKPLALASGLGALGRNGLIITPEAGSLVIIAAMTLPFALESDGPLEVPDTVPGTVFSEFPLCGGCDTERPPCAAACPTGAMGNTGVLNRERCIQWYASGKEAAVPAVVAAQWGRRLYGCTGCQDACVRNQRPIPGAETSLGPLPPYLDGRELLSLTDAEIKARFKGTALGLSWLGPEGLRRNIRTALGI
jgi:epoxyqueuosine reductase